MLTTQHKRPITAELPLWMQQAQRSLDWGALIVAMLSLLMALSLLLNDGFNVNNSNENYAFQAQDIAEALHEGRLYPRWSPHALSGYGAPVPHFAPPAAPYAVAVIDTLLTGQIYPAMRLLYAVALLMSGGAVYALTLRWMGAPSAVLAAVLYVYSPYVGLTAPHVLGDLPSSMAAALTPMLLWAISRLITVNRFQDFIVTVLISAALILTLPAAAGVGAGLALILTFAERRRATPRVVAALIMSVLLTAFFWLPALLEAGQVRWLESSNGASQIALTLEALLRPLTPIDRAELQVSPQFTLGLTLTVFAALGFIGAVRLSWRTRFPLVMLGAGGALTVAGLTVFPHETWLLAPISLCAALGGSAALSLRESLRPTLFRLYLPTLLIGAIVGGIPVLVPRITDTAPREPTPLAQIQYEQQGYGVAVLPRSARLPSTLPDTVTPDRFLTSSYSDTTLSGGLTRISPDALPLGVMVLPTASETHATRLQITSRAPFVLPLLLAGFEGWQAALNGDPLPTQANPQNGLITVRIPSAQNGLFEIRLTTTPPRTAAWLISTAAFFLLLFITRRRQTRQPSAPFYDNLNLLTTAETRRLAVTTAAAALMVLAVSRPESPLVVRVQDYSGLSGARLIEARTTNGLEIIGYHLNDTRFNAGDTLSLDLYWRTLRFLPDNYRVQVTLEDVNRQSVLMSAPLRYPAGYPTRRWSTDGYITDRYRFTLPTDTLPGSYRISIEVYNCPVNTCTRADRIRFFASTGEQSTLRLPDALIVPR